MFPGNHEGVQCPGNKLRNRLLISVNRLASSVNRMVYVAALLIRSPVRAAVSIVLKCTLLGT